MSRTFRQILTAVLTGLLCTPCLAVLIPRYDLPELVRAARGIYHVNVVDRSAAWNEDRTEILTQYTLEVRQTLKGPLVSQLVISEMGGVVGDMGMSVAGVPEYRVGEEAVIFTHEEKGRRMTLYFRQGKFPVRIAPQGRVVEHPSLDRHLSLDAFKQEVAGLRAKRP